MKVKSVALPPVLAGRGPALLMRGRIMRLLDVSGYDAVVLDCVAVQAAGHDYLHELFWWLAPHIAGPPGAVRLGSVPSGMMHALRSLDAAEPAPEGVAAPGWLFGTSDVEEAR